MKLMGNGQVTILATALGVIALASCAADGVNSPTSSSVSIVGTEDRPLTWDASVVEDYSDLAAAARASSMIVEGVAGDSSVEIVADVPFTVTNVAVTRFVHAKAVTRTVEVRQFGNEYNADGSFARLLRAGETYVLFLKPFEFERGKATGQWVIVGGSAAWRANGSGGFESIATDSALPQLLTAGDLQRLNDDPATP